MRIVCLVYLLHFILLIKLFAGPISNEIDFLPSLYVSNPDKKAVSPMAIRGPCGRNSLGYLHAAAPMGFIVVEDTCPLFDRKNLIPLPEAKPREADSFKDHPFEPPIVRPEKKPAEVLTVATHPEVALPLAPATQDLTDQIIEELFNNTVQEIKIPKIEAPQAKKILPEALDSLNLTIPQSQMLLPEALLYYFQNNGSSNPSQPSAILPFDVPLSGINNNNTTNFSSATYVVE